MQTWKLRERVLDELALTWLEEPGHAFTALEFATERHVPGAEVRRALIELKTQGLVALRHEDSWVHLTAVLTPQGQRVWVRDCAEASWPGTRALLERAHHVLLERGPATQGDLQVALELPTARVRQMVLMLRGLEWAKAALDVNGSFTGIRLLTRVVDWG